MTSEKRAQKLHSVDASLTISWQCLRLDENLLHPIKFSIQILAVTITQFRISVVDPQTSFRWETIGCVAKVGSTQIYQKGSEANNHHEPKRTCFNQLVYQKFCYCLRFAKKGIVAFCKEEQFMFTTEQSFQRGKTKKRLRLLFTSKDNSFLFNSNSPVK